MFAGGAQVPADPQQNGIVVLQGSKPPWKIELLTGSPHWWDTHRGWRSLCRRFPLRNHPGDLAGTLRTLGSPLCRPCDHPAWDRAPLISLLNLFAEHLLDHRRPPPGRSDLQARCCSTPSGSSGRCKHTALSPNRRQGVPAPFGCATDLATTHNAVMPNCESRAAQRASGARPASCAGAMTGQWASASPRDPVPPARLAGLGQQRQSSTGMATKPGPWGRWAARCEQQDAPSPILAASSSQPATGCSPTLRLQRLGATDASSGWPRLPEWRPSRS